MKKPRKRFNSEAEILTKIDETHAHAKGYGALADAKEDEAKALFKSAASESNAKLQGGMITKGKQLMTEVKKLRKRSARLMDSKCKSLGAKLAEFRTELIPVAGVGDTSVPQ